MPIVEINILEGRTVEQKRVMVASVTQAICASLSVPAEKVCIKITDMENHNYSIAGVLEIDKK